MEIYAVVDTQITDDNEMCTNLYVGTDKTKALESAKKCKLCDGFSMYEVYLETWKDGVLISNIYIQGA